MFRLPCRLRLLLVSTRVGMCLGDHLRLDRQALPQRRLAPGRGLGRQQPGIRLYRVLRRLGCALCRLVCIQGSLAQRGLQPHVGSGRGVPLGFGARQGFRRLSLHVGSNIGARFCALCVRRRFDHLLLRDGLTLRNIMRARRHAFCVLLRRAGCLSLRREVFRHFLSLLGRLVRLDLCCVPLLGCRRQHRLGLSCSGLCRVGHLHISLAGFRQRDGISPSLGRRLGLPRSRLVPVGCFLHLRERRLLGRHQLVVLRCHLRELLAHRLEKLARRFHLRRQLHLLPALCSHALLGVEAILVQPATLRQHLRGFFRGLTHPVLRVRESLLRLTRFCLPKDKRRERWVRWAADCLSEACWVFGGSGSAAYVGLIQLDAGKVDRVFGACLLNGRLRHLLLCALRDTRFLLRKQVCTTFSVERRRQVGGGRLLHDPSLVRGGSRRLQRRICSTDLCRLRLGGRSCLNGASLPCCQQLELLVLCSGKALCMLGNAGCIRRQICLFIGDGTAVIKLDLRVTLAAFTSAATDDLLLVTR